MYAARSPNEGTRAGHHQEQNGSDTKEQEEELTKADRAGVLLLGAEKVAKGGEHHPLRVVPMEKMQDQRDGHGQARHEKNRRKEAHQPRRSRLRR